jgi:hypothetical protein
MCIINVFDVYVFFDALSVLKLTPKQIDGTERKYSMSATPASTTRNIKQATTEPVDKE